MRAACLSGQSFQAIKGKQVPFSPSPRALLLAAAAFSFALPPAEALAAEADLAVEAAAEAQDAARSATDAMPVEGDEEETGGDIIVTATRSAASVLSDIPADQILDEQAVASYGASSAADLVAALSVQTRSGRGRGSGPPVVLVDGRRVSGFGEIRNLPPEAIARVEIFPEEVALEYGYAADQRVINFILKDNFFAITTEVEAGGATDGGRWNQEVEASILRLRGKSRLNITAEYSRDTPLTEAERGIIQSQPATPLALGGVITAPGGGEIDPALSAAAGRVVTIAGVPAGGGTTAAFASATVPGTTDQAPFRTLLSGGDSISIDATLARPLAERVNGSANIRFERATSDSLLGLSGGSIRVPGANPFNPLTNDVLLTRAYAPDGPLTGSNRSDTFHAGVSSDGRLGRWRWTLTGNYDRAEGRTISDRGVDLNALQNAVNAGANAFIADPAALVTLLAPDRTESTSNTGDADLVLSGTLFDLPAGRVRTTLQGGWRGIGFDSISERAGVSTLTDLSRTVWNGSVNVDVPIASRSDDVLAAIGDLSVNGRYALRDVSDFRTLTSWTVGGTWSPIERVDFIASWIGEDNAPSVSQLGAPLLVTPLRAVYDFSRGETVLADVITGGNPALLAEARRDLKLTANWRPIAETDLLLTATYGRTRSRNTTSDLPALTPEIEAAFPGRVTRDASGRIISVDQRPVNFAATRGEQLRWGISFSRSFGQQAGGPGGGRGPGMGAGGPPPGAGRPAGAGGPQTGGPQAGAPGGGGGPRMGGGGGGGMRGMFGGPGGSGGRWSLAAFHTVRFQDEILIRPGVPVLDLLDGSATGSTGGSARHQVEFDGGWFYRGFGVRGNGTWQSGTTVVGGPAVGGGTASDLRFSGLFTVNLRAFVNFDQQTSLVEAVPFLKGSRIRLSIDNLFNDRLNVRDDGGLVPLRYQPGLIDPLGRRVELSFRKQF